MSGTPERMTADEFDRLFQQVKNRSRWGADDQRGALNLLTPKTLAGERLGRWQFLFMIAPWRLAGGTASP